MHSRKSACLCFTCQHLALHIPLTLAVMSASTVIVCQRSCKKQESRRNLARAALPLCTHLSDRWHCAVAKSADSACNPESWPLKLAETKHVTNSPNVPNNMHIQASSLCFACPHCALHIQIHLTISVMSVSTFIVCQRSCKKQETRRNLARAALPLCTHLSDRWHLAAAKSADSACNAQSWPLELAVTTTCIFKQQIRCVFCVHILLHIYT